MSRLVQVRLRRLQRPFFLSSFFIRYALLVLVLLEVNNGIIHLCAPFANALIIVTVPSSASDYRQLASLLVSTFDAPSLVTKSTLNNEKDEKDSLKTKLDLLQWSLYDKSLTEQYTYKQYMSTTKRMWGKKYCLFVAKEYIPGNGEKGSRASYKVVGMVEMGMSIGPAPLDTDECLTDCENTNRSNLLRPRATIGVLCVESAYQKQGVGQSLLKKCEEVADDVWKEDRVFVDVEPSNVKAMAFFERCRYNTFMDKSGNLQMRNATISRRRTSESRLHIILGKKFTEAELDCPLDNALIDSH